MKPIRIILADDHPLFLEGMATILPLKDPDIQVIGTATSAAEVLELLEHETPDVLLLDVRMPGQSGIELTRLLKSQGRDIPVLILTTYDDPMGIQDALRAGAKGFLFKDAPGEQIVQAIQALAKGNALLSVKALEAIFTTGGPTSSVPARDNLDPELSYRACEILLLIGRGMDNQAIADRLFISEKTVRNYVSNIYDILDVHSRPQAILYAQEHKDDLERRVGQQ